MSIINTPAQVTAFVKQFCEHVATTQVRDLDEPVMCDYWVLPDQLKYALEIQQNSEHIIVHLAIIQDGYFKRLGNCFKQQPDWLKNDYYMNSGFRSDWGVNAGKPSGFMPWFTKVLTEIQQETSN